MERLTCTDKPVLNPWVRCKEAIKRLAAYEDSGMGPDAVEAMKTAMMGKAIAEIKELDDIPIDHLRELAQAEKEGRLVVLPCKVGDLVYIYSEKRGIRTEKVRTLFLGHPSYRIEDRMMQMVRTETCDIPFSELGTRLFLTREEAKAALEVQEGDSHEADI